ncbi:rod shape-determining protein [Geobacter sp. AOG2]|uniref:rod shape-determining protein n=1 Tax=Geobacter sp. AOG2 TaxID=1566347 RepID=UPI001CC7FA22|nr:rod shape-determining protein [Geobacter sp. AOG2]GFE61441.1 rod shape-determining protein [Geobacter sp. AOG2]
MAKHWGGLSPWRPDIAIDLGTATTRIVSKGHGVITRSSMAGNAPALSSGVVVNGDAVVALLEPLISKMRIFGMIRPRAVACAPTDANAWERNALIEGVSRGGAAAVVVVPEPLAAAVGAGVDIVSPYARMVVDIGEGVTDCAVITSGKVVDTAALRGGCGALRKAVRDAAFRRRNVRISPRQAELLVRAALCGSPAVSTQALGASGEDSPVLQPISLVEAREAFEPVAAAILGLITGFLREIPHSTGSEIIENGITLTGGGALLAGMRERIQAATGITVMPVANPLEAVVQGAYAMLPIMAMLNMWKR